MAFADDVEPRIEFDAAFSDADKTTITNAIKEAYDGSAIAKKMIDDYLAVSAARKIKVTFDDDNLAAGLGTGEIFVDLDFFDDANYIDNNGTAVQDTVTTGIVHELVHALQSLEDNFDAMDYRGDTVTFSNTIYKQLGEEEQNSYIAYDNSGDILTRGFKYTNGAAIDRSASGDQNHSSVAAGNSKDLLIGGPGANTLSSGPGNDFLFGAGGDDIKSGGAGSDTAVLTGKPVDYDIRLNPDGTVTSRHVRGDADEGTDTFRNVEKVQFEGGQTFNLVKNGLTFQTDIAFVVDQTGSMGDDIAAVKTAATGLVDALFASGTIDARIGIVGFRDNDIGQPTEIILPFTDQDVFADRQAAAIAGINSLSASGGGDFPESAFDGLLKALDGSVGDFRTGAGTKRIALFTDATAKDVELLPQVLALALNVGVSVSASASATFGDIARTDTFELTFDDGVLGRDLVSDGRDGLPFTPDDDPVTPFGGTATVAITTIFIEGFTDPDDALAEVSEASGGSVLSAADPDEVVARLLEVVTAANYFLSVDVASVDEGDAGVTEVDFTLTRDRTDNAATVTFATTGDADGDDVTGAPTTVDFAAGEATKTITVSVVGDTEVEADETFGLQITDIDENATFSASPVTFTILNDDEEGDDEAPAGPTAGPDLLVGTPGEDMIRGLGGDDTIIGRAGGDRLVGMAGDDLLIGHRGGDMLIGSRGDDTLLGGAGADVLKGQIGDDLLIGEGGRDELIGGAGSDILEGSNGMDLLHGGRGDDLLHGGRGFDTLTGGLGRDTFHFEKGDRRDTVTDYTDGWDLIGIGRGARSFDDLEIVQRGDMAVIGFSNVQVMLENTDARDLDAADFVFS